MSLNKKRRFLYSIKAGDIKAAAQTIDPNDHGLNPCSDRVKNELKGKFRDNSSNGLGTPLPIFSSIFFQYIATLT